jgi:transcriptional regulator GlxA family with amidase domain
VITCSPDGGPLTTATDFTIGVEHGVEAMEGADTLVVPPFAWEPADHGGSAPTLPTDVFARLRPGTRVVSICTAAVLLAAAGLLDGRPATTHWAEAGHFQKLFPKVELDPDVLFVDDGDVLTSAGAAAGVDLCLHVIRRDHGSEVANRAARRCVVPPWRDGGQAQYIERPVPEPHDTGTAPVRAWALERLDRPLSLADLAAQAGMSVRTLTRRFREEVGVSPGRWLTLQRIERARHLLEATDLPVDQIARMAGFGTAVSLRQHLHATLGVAPIAYRRTFQPVGEI